MKIIIAFILALYANTSLAVSVMGSKSCGEWIAQKPVGDDKSWPRIISEAWLIGYISGRAAATGKDVLRDAAASGLILWVDNYCQMNPLAYTDEAGAKLFQELRRRSGI